MSLFASRGQHLRLKRSLGDVTKLCLRTTQTEPIQFLTGTQKLRLVCDTKILRFRSH